MQYKILASDYDNTLVPFGENQPRPAMVKAVKKLQAAGGKFVLSTGRAWSAINRKGQLGGIRFDYAITCNGACVVDKNGAIVAEHPMTNEEMYALVDFCEDYNYPLQFDFKDAYYAYCEYDILHKYYDQMNSVGLDCVDGEDQDRHLIDMPHAAFCLFPEGALERFNEKYGHLGLHFMQTGGQLPDGSHFYDIVRGGIDKGAGLADLCEKMGLSLAEAVAAGDSANDVGMLKAAGLGCCMSNGTDEAKAAADRIIGDVREDGGEVDEAGQPIEGVDVDVWQASTVGLYENQDADQADMNLRGKFRTDAAGCITFRTIKPVGYPIPLSGPVGALLGASTGYDVCRAQIVGALDTVAAPVAVCVPLEAISASVMLFTLAMATAAATSTLPSEVVV